MSDIGDVRVGTILRYNGELCMVTEYIHRTPGNLRAFYQAKMKNLKTGKIVENRFRAGEAVEIARVEYKEMQFIYPEGSHIVVMDNSTYEQMHIPAEMFGDNAKFLKEGMEVSILRFNDKPVSIELPIKIELKVTEAPPSNVGNSGGNVTKPVTLETGLVVNAPMFIKEGDVIRIDTRDGQYVERVAQ